jgi:hypothetical protein
MHSLVAFSNRVRWARSLLVHHVVFDFSTHALVCGGAPCCLALACRPDRRSAPCLEAQEKLQEHSRALHRSLQSALKKSEAWTLASTAAADKARADSERLRESIRAARWVCGLHLAWRFVGKSHLLCTLVFDGQHSLMCCCHFDM